MTKSSICINLNAQSDVPSDATILISGPPRSGTSMVASALHAAGFHLGNNLDAAVFESAHQTELFGRRTDWRKRLVQAAKHPDARRLALAGFDIAGIKKFFGNQNAAHEKWGFKRPNTHAFIAQGGLSLVRNPRLIMVFRDPLAIAQRISTAQNLPIKVGLNWAHRDTNLNMLAARHAEVPVLLVGHEKAKANVDGFLDELFAFCGLAIPPQRYERIKTLATEAGEQYLRVSSGPMVGSLGLLSAGVLRGWARSPGKDEPEDVEIYADDVKIAELRAEEYWPDLEKAGHGTGRHGFSIKLSHLKLKGSARIRVFIASSKVELHNSGRLLRELRPK